MLAMVFCLHEAVGTAQRSESVDSSLLKSESFQIEVISISEFDAWCDKISAEFDRNAAIAAKR